MRKTKEFGCGEETTEVSGNIGGRMVARGYGAHARGQRETVFGGPLDPTGGMGQGICTTHGGTARGHIALVRPQVLKMFSGAIHG